jgi:hypothetical protein
MMQEEIPGSIVSWACQDLLEQMEWAHCQRALALDFHRRGRLAMLTCRCCFPLWCFDLFSFYNVGSTMIDRVHKFQLLHNAFQFDFSRFGRKRHGGPVESVRLQNV